MVINVRHPSDANSRVRSVGDDNVRLPEHAGDAVLLDLAERESGHQPCDLGECVAVFVGRADSYHDGRLPVAGRYERHGDSLSFTPASASFLDWTTSCAVDATVSLTCSPSSEFRGNCRPCMRS